MMTMTVHFLLSAAARTLSLREIYKGGEDAAYETFKTLRWAETDGEPVCPACGCVEAKPVKGRITYRFMPGRGGPGPARP